MRVGTLPCRANSCHCSQGWIIVRISCMHAGGEKCSSCLQPFMAARMRHGYVPHAPGRVSYRECVRVLVKHGLRADAVVMRAAQEIKEYFAPPAHRMLMRQLAKEVRALEAAGPVGSASAAAPPAAGAAAPPLSPRPPPACWQCGQTGCKLQRCSGCKAARYCSAACQKLHWKAHKAECVRQE